MITLNNVFTEYLLLKSPLHAVQTVNSYISIFNTHLKYSLGNRDITTISYKDLQLLLNNLIKSGLKPKTVENIKVFLSTLFSLSMSLDYIRYNPVKFCQIKKYDNKRYFNYSVQQQEHIINSIKSYYRLEHENPFSDVLFFLLHGRRLGEVLKLQWKYINLFTQFYFVPDHINKTRTNMTYKMTSQLHKMLLDRFVNNPHEDEDYVFLNPQTNTHYKSFRKSWIFFKHNYALPEKMRLHDIRHLIATYSINTLNISVEHVSKALGHKNITTTQRYLTLNPVISKQVINKLLSA